MLELLDIHKHFGAVRANDGVTMRVEAGSIHGLLGENGAGKSTLMKVLAGFITADSGQIFLGGERLEVSNPKESVAAGIGLLHQDPLLCLPFSVLDNFLLGRPGSMILDREAGRVELEELAARFDFQFSATATARTLTVGERQQLEILRLLSLGVRVLILDEPTTAISATQRVLLFATLRRLADDVAFSLTLHETDLTAWAQAAGLPEQARSPEGPKCQLRSKPRLAERASYLFITAPREVTRLARATLCSVRRRIERLLGRPVSESEGFEAMLDHALESWGHPGAEVKREHRIFDRDGWRCAAPGCTSYRNLQAHHMRWRSRGGSDAPENLITLCAYHHQRCIHAAPTRLRITGRAPDRLCFEMPWGRYRSGDVRCDEVSGRAKGVRP